MFSRTTLLLLPALMCGLAARGLGAEQQPAVATGASTSRALAVAAGEPRDEFVAAMKRVRLHLPEPPDPPALRAYVIYEYLVAARLRRDLARSAGDDLDGAIDTFLQAHGSEPVTRALRHEWLASLAQRARWDWFLPRSRDVTDPLLSCERLRGLLLTGETQGLKEATLARWSVAQEPPPACDEPFAWARAQHVFTPELAEARMRAALGADNPRLARQFATDLPGSQAAPLLQWAQLLDTPELSLSALARSPDISVEPDALVAGFTRLARANSASADALLPALLARPQLSPSLVQRLRRAAALGDAYDHAAGAVTAFTGFSADPSDEPVQEWRVRAALWAGNYAQALSWIEQMPPALANLPRWRYWRARAVAATSGEAAAEPLFVDLAGLRDYHGYLAADRVHHSYSINAKVTPDDPSAQAALTAAPGMERAHALFACDELDDAGAEWALVVAHQDAAVKVQAARLAASWGWYAQSIATLAQSGDFDDVRLRYPRPYPAAVAAASGLAHVPGDWILAVMRQESLFRVDAVSRANARGLMQMLPATADAVAKRWHLPQPPVSALFDPMVAISLGAAHLRELLDHYDGQLEVTLAAYNAGMAPVARWQPPAPVAADIWIENIPYNETRNYVQHTLEHIVAFAWVRDAELPELSALLSPVGKAAAPERAGQDFRTR
jgi:soluble lytic murein transglycosylase